MGIFWELGAYRGWRSRGEIDGIVNPPKITIVIARFGSNNVGVLLTDGFEFGLGAEIGISTDRLHARGPMGLEELCTYKYQIIGDGQWK